MNKYAKQKEPDVSRMTPAQVIAYDMIDVQDEIINEAVEHFIGTRSREIEDDGRYFPNALELVKFKQKFKEKMVEYNRKGLPYTRLSELHIGIVEELSYHNDPYYEVCRQKYYDLYPEFFFS